MPIRLNLNDPPAEPVTEPESTSSQSLGVAVETLPRGRIRGIADTERERPAPSSNGSGNLPSCRRSRYEELDPTDLLHIIDELEGNRCWASLREKLWIALIIHMLVAWYLLYGPKYIYHVRVVDPSVIMKQRQKDLTFLDLPPDALKPVKPKTQAPLSDKDRQAETPQADAGPQDPRGTGGDEARRAAGARRRSRASSRPLLQRRLHSSSPRWRSSIRPRRPRSRCRRTTQAKLEAPPHGAAAQLPLRQRRQSQRAAAAGHAPGHAGPRPVRRR